MTMLQGEGTVQSKFYHMKTFLLGEQHNPSYDNKVNLMP